MENKIFGKRSKIDKTKINKGMIHSQIDLKE